MKNLTLGFFAQTFGGSSYTCMEARTKFWAQKVNVKFFTVDPYPVGTGVPRTFLEITKIYKKKIVKNGKCQKINLQKYISISNQFGDVAQHLIL